MSLEHILNKKQPRSIYNTSLTEIKEDQNARKWKHEEEVSDSDWKGMEKELEEYRESNNWWNFTYQASRMRIIDPSHQLNITEKEWKGMEKILEKDRKSNHWLEFAEQASYMRIIDPSHQLNIAETEWKGMEEELEKYRKSNYWLSFAYQASSMRVLIAHKVEVYKQGIEITDEPPKPLVVSPPRPVRRRI